MRLVYLLIVGLLFCIVYLTQPLVVYAKDSLSYIIVNLPSHSLEYYQNDILIKEYPIAIGKPTTPTPIGSYSIVDKEINPRWYPPGKGYSIPSGPNNPLGYRWMGFSEDYGIHGTNMPWSIGTASSNGCIRMQEENVEELFDLVKYNTPVHITYDRVKIKVDKKGWASIGVYPDVYGYNDISLADVKARLAEKGLGGLVSDSFLTQLINEEAGEQVVFAQVHNIKVNKKYLTQRMITLQGIMYIPILTVAESLDINVKYDNDNMKVIGKQHSVPGLIKGNNIYVAAKDMMLLFSGRQVWHDEENCLVIDLPNVMMDGKIITNDVQIINGIKNLPALKIASAIGLRVNWDETKKVLTLGMHKVPVTVLNDEPYISIKNIRSYFNANVSWDESEQILAMNYPYYPLDYSMYIDQMADFF